MKKYFLLLFVAFFSFCVNDVDFEQANDFVLEPVFTSSLVSFTVFPINFFDSTGTIQQNSITDVSQFRAFDNSFFRDNVIQLDFNVEAKNEFDRKVTITIDLLDADNNLTYELTPIEVESGNLDYSFQEMVVISENPLIVNTLKVRIKAELESSTTALDLTDRSEFEFKSAFTAYIVTN